MMPSTDTPFWFEVQEHLVGRRGILPGRERVAINEYVARLEADGVADLIDHSEPQDIADAVYRSRRLASDYPLPGGDERYFDTLTAVLQRVGDDGVSTAGLRAWYLDRFAVTGRRALQGYLSQPLRMGLYRVIEGRIVLTALGRRLIRTEQESGFKARGIVAELKCTTLLGYREILELLSRERGLSKDEITGHLCESLGLAWQTDRQTLFRLNWLTSLGLVATGQPNRFELTPAGSDFVSKHAFAVMPS